MKRLIRVLITSNIIFSCISCTAYLNPHDFNIERVEPLSLNIPRSISIRTNFVGTKERELPLAGVTVTVKENEFTKVLASGIKGALRRNKFVLDSNAEKSIEVQVVRVSLQPDRSIYCVIDYNCKLGDGVFYGFQSRAKNWSFITACENALIKAVSDILHEPNTVKYLQGE